MTCACGAVTIAPKSTRCGPCRLTHRRAIGRMCKQRARDGQNRLSGHAVARLRTLAVSPHDLGLTCPLRTEALAPPKTYTGYEWCQQIDLEVVWPR